MLKRLIPMAALLVSMTACGQSSTPAVGPFTPTSTPAPTPIPFNTANVAIVAGAQTLTTTAFDPNPITVAAGTTITWMNNDTFAHTSTSDGGLWNSGRLTPGASFSLNFATAGSFTYHCTIHPNMVGTVNVQ